MTITIGRTTLLVVLAALLIGAAGVGGYLLGRNSQDLRAVRQAAARKADAAGYKRGLADDLKAQQEANKENGPGEEMDKQIYFLGYDDWKNGDWYAVHIVRHKGEYAPVVYTVNNRQHFSPGLEYSVCGAD